MMRPRIPAALIVKDEAGFLRECLSSIRYLVDEIVVVDTGSSDESVAVAESFGAKVLHLPWDGRFAPPRNLGLEHATGDWILYIDADECVVETDRDALHAALDRADAAGILALRVRFAFRLGFTPYHEWRLWRHRPDIRFEGVMHEVVSTAILRVMEAEGLTCEETDVLTIEHHGYEGDQTAKHRRNIPMLLQEVERTPDRTYLWDHLGRCHQGLGDRVQAHAAWHRAIELVRRGGVRSALDGLAYADLAEDLFLAGEDPSPILDEGLRLFPDNFHLRFVAACHAEVRGDPVAALAHADRLVAATEAEIIASGLGYDRRMFTDRAHALRGASLFALGRWAESAAAYGQATALRPEIEQYRILALLAAGKARAAGAT